MSLFNIFKGKTPLAYEQNGDTYAKDGLWGNAKVEYEKALNRLEKEVPIDGKAAERLAEKVAHVSEELAHEHQENAINLVAGGYGEEARDLFSLALELTRDAALEKELREGIEALEKVASPASALESPEWEWVGDDTDEGTGGAEIPGDQSETFLALCGTLPDDVQMAYLGYGSNFKIGYLALNAGDFQTAAQYLALAMADNKGLDTYIPLELATALLNQGRHAQARDLLEPFIESHPDVLPAYQLLCDLYWDQGEIDLAKGLLASIEEDLKASVSVALLKGETRRRAGDDPGARSFYLQFMETHGWHESIARALAETNIAMGEMAEARGIYQSIMDNCLSCHVRIDPFIKEQYAEVCFATGSRDTATLELYLSLAQEIREKAPLYYDRVSRIYADQGNEAEASRFRSFSEQLRTEATKGP
ncbi:MAG: tetratricopeptide repeat protein [Thermodesulfobacteriota bacterium]